MSAPAKPWVVAAWSLVATVLGFIPGLGLPGGIMLAMGSFILSPFVRIIPALDQANWPADAWWPAAIVLTFTLFPFFVAAHHVAFRTLREKPRTVKWCAWIGMLLLWSAIGHAAMSAMVANGI